MERYKIKSLTFTYPGGETPALNDIALTVKAGEFITLCGQSGCGKSTLLRHLKPALAPHGAKTGEILFDGLPLDSLDHKTQS
ncbi:MAG: ATP-binding cassette domain-containing protein, partial [Clostridia bacterium]|nr:ATP-binding cassette domain-containing protein [Clostridia bacterium]